MVKEGYKDTEIGVIPLEWDVVKLGDFCDILDNKRVPLSSEQRATIKGDIPYYGANGVVDYINDFLFDEELVLLAEDGGNFSEYETRPIAYMIDGKSWVNNHTHILRAKNNQNHFLFYNLVHKNIMAFINGGTRAKLNRGELVKIKIPLPPLKEQEKIADILSTADDKIDAITIQIEKAETLKKGLLQKLLSEGLGHSEFKDSELGKIPESWEIVELGSCVDGKGNYGIGAAAVNYNENLPTYLRITDIDVNGKFISTNKKCVDSPEAFNYQLKDGDIVFARTGNTTGKTYHYNPADGVLIYAGFLIKFTPNKELLDTYYLKLQTEISRYWNWVKVTSMRTGQPGINSEEYSKLLLPLPPLKEQKQIANILSTADKKLEVLRTKKEKYVTLKKGLMQKLLSGEVRVGCVS